MGWVCSTNRSERERKFVFVGRKLGRLRYRKENDIKIDIQGIEWGGGVWTGLFWLRKETSDGCCEHDNKHSVSTKCVKFLG